MELRAKEITKILSNFLKVKLTETPLGEGVEVVAREAFLFSVLANAYYFDSLIAPYKFFLRVCNSALDFHLVNGLFDNHLLSQTPHLACKRHDYVKGSNKIIVPVEINGPNSLRNKLESVYGPRSSDPNIVLLIVDLTKKGHGLEPLMEYLTCKFFSREGFVTETQISLSHSQGNPDFGCYSLPDIQNIVTENELLPRGFNVLELAMLRDFSLKLSSSSSSSSSYKDQSDFLVGDAKTSTTSMKIQINKYLDTGFFNQAVECHPSKLHPSKKSWGIFNIRDNVPCYKKAEVKEDFSNKESQKDYVKWLSSYLNFFLLANYNNDELNEVSNDFINTDVCNRQDVVRLVTEIDFSTHVDMLKKYLKSDKNAFK